MSTEHRRRAPRRRFDGQVGVLFKGKLTTARGLQLGEGGALIAAHTNLQELKVDQEVVLTLYLPSIGGMVATAKCVYWKDDLQIGFQFNSLDMEYKKKVREFVSRRKQISEVA